MSRETGWSADRRLWAEVEANVGQLGWRRVPFAATSAFSVPARSGVYMICASPAVSLGVADAGRPGLYTALYVGKGDLRARFGRHTGTRPKAAIREYTRTFSGRLDFWYVPIAGAAQVDATEAALIRALRPPCNDQYPRLRVCLGPAVALGQPNLADAGGAGFLSGEGRMTT